MKSVKTAQFTKLFANLPIEIQKKARKNYQLWKADNKYPGLHFKQINARLSIYSVRVGLYHRALGVKKGETIIWFWIGSHEDYNNMISQM